MSAPFGEQGKPFGGDPVDLAADVAELLPGHGSGLHARGDALRDDRGLEMGQRDPGRQVAQVGAGPLRVPFRQVGARREAGRVLGAGVIAGLWSPGSRQ